MHAYQFFLEVLLTGLLSRSMLPAHTSVLCPLPDTRGFVNVVRVKITEALWAPKW